MARVKRAVNAQKKRRAILEQASGYRGQRSRLYRKAKEQVTHSCVRLPDRKKRKATSAGCGSSGSTPRPAPTASPTTAHPGPKAAGVEVDRKISPTWPSTTPPRSPRWSRSPRRRCDRRERPKVAV